MAQNDPHAQPQLPFFHSGPRQFVRTVGDYVWSLVLLIAYGLGVAFSIGVAYLAIRILIFGIRLVSHAIGLEAQ